MKSGSKFWPPEDMKFEFPFRPYLINFLVQSRRRDRVDPKMLGKPSERAYKAIGQLKLWCPLVVKTCCHFSGSRFLLIFGNLFWCLTYPPWEIQLDLCPPYTGLHKKSFWLWRADLGFLYPHTSSKTSNPDTDYWFFRSTVKFDSFTDKNSPSAGHWTGAEVWTRFKFNMVTPPDKVD